MFRRDELKIIFDSGLLEFVDAEPIDGSALILRVGCIYVLRAIHKSEFMGKKKRLLGAFSIAASAATVSTLYPRRFMRLTLHL